MPNGCPFPFSEKSELLDQEKLYTGESLKGWSVRRFLGERPESQKNEPVRHRLLRQCSDTTIPAASLLLPKSDSETTDWPRGHSHSMQSDGGSLPEVCPAPNEITYSAPSEGYERLIGGRLVFQRLDALLDESDATGFIGNTFDQREIGLVLREGPFRIRGLVRLSQVVAGNGIVGAERDGFFE